MKRLALIAPFALLLSACEDPTPVAAAAGDAAPPKPSTSAPAAPASAPTAPSNAAAPAPSATGEKAPLQLLKLTLTSAVKDREPADELKSAAPGQRVWAHVVVRNRTGEAKRISLIFRVGGEERSTVDLKVDPSWSYRTWGYNTLKSSDKTGELTVEVRELGGGELTSVKLPIKPAKPGDQ